MALGGCRPGQWQRQSSHLVTPNLAATFSEVMPMGSIHDLACLTISIAGLTPPCHVIGLEDMDSTPPASPTV